MVTLRPYFSLTLFDAPVERLLEEFSGWMNGYQTLEVPFSIPNQPCRREDESSDGIFWEPMAYPGRTAFAPNVAHPSSFYAVNAGERFKYRTIEVRTSEPEEAWPVNEFALYENGALRRHIQVLRDDDHWDFYSNGEPLCFENPEHSRKRQIRDRFNRDLLLDYLKKSGWDLCLDEFWQSNMPAYAFVKDPQWNAERPCPFCGKPLKTPRAKQCLHCGRNWRNA
jgi:hypothetical protein